MTATEYGVLHYRGDVTGSEDAQPGALLPGRWLAGDGTSWPWQVIDAELIAAPAYEGCLDCTLPLPHTHVHLETASVEAVRHAMHKVHVHQSEGLTRAQRRQQARADGTLGKKPRRR